ncbi:hypothetical protein PMNALOAF_4162 [Methylobacterium adhaesivum]|uniref:Uncharacterized protein n=1 Tax=Methylobacterium adhaesivum TaxID=333297 RepID=A0ABT8BM65_9HYPH|nr:hypothetical protein [Methylobacterium adhaesivum]MDN3593236.1 hypothetical protein [Methylobacterium adhaesivum]GJD32882.1 hypothetical protein PMNALOAF_4162 [Methylobacterium adhaesivum]
MIGSSASWPISVRIAFSGFVGVVVSVLLVLAHADHGDPSSDSSLFVGALSAFAVAMIVLELALILAGPLIVIAIVCGVLLRRSIERHLLTWSLAAPIIVWLFACGVMASTSASPAAAAQGLLRRLAAAILAKENLLFLFGPGGSGVAFYVLSAVRKRRRV